MLTKIDKILSSKKINIQDIMTLISVKNPIERQKIIDKAYAIKIASVSNKVYLRGLIEYSNKCEKNCLYCGIRSGNKDVDRYELDEVSVLKSAKYAIDHGFGSIVIQSGELSESTFIDKMESIIKKIVKLSAEPIGITLSCGEQSIETYQKWFDAGATRYLLRIETTNEELYYKIHPKNAKHSFENRMKCLQDLKEVGYQTGTGIMIGLPFQTIEDLARDLKFFRKIDIDMVGMGPYLEHDDTPMSKYHHLLDTKEERFQLSLLMIAVLRILMKDINISASTALQSVDPNGREKGLLAGANVIMPNLTDISFKSSYQLYNNKPGLDENAVDFMGKLEGNLRVINEKIAYNIIGNSAHFENRQEESCCW